MTLAMSYQDDDSVWSKDIEDAFEEALRIYPPCGRRKIILSEEGKMYGRNELIARYIKLRTGKHRTRKQVSSHIQVLARKKQRELSSKLKSCDEETRKNALESLASMSSAQIVSATMNFSTPTHQNAQHLNLDARTGAAYTFPLSKPKPSQRFEERTPTPAFPGDYIEPNSGYQYPLKGGGLRQFYMTNLLAFKESYWDGNRNIFPIVHISGFQSFEQPESERIDIWQILDKFPGLVELFNYGPRESFFLVKVWADLPLADAPDNYFISYQFEGPELVELRCVNKVYSFGKDIAETITHPERPYYNNLAHTYIYNFPTQPLCTYLVNFINKLKTLPNLEMMNSVLENLSLLQLVTEVNTNKIMFCCAYIFEVHHRNVGSQYHVYALTDGRMQ
ncbi:hypothetical protein Zmor_012350 [Zophobas morio]|uniref:TEA domain-containing protein n=1 Tax=Zophobas morio TaxID=2755281 RepID=A0AA38LZ75_9CUCU|nr:hypothetical protein Zmor_012350 [Zophobas morio]